MPCVIGDGGTGANCRGAYFAKWFIGVVKTHHELIGFALDYERLCASVVALSPIGNGKSFVEYRWFA